MAAPSNVFDVMAPAVDLDVADAWASQQSPPIRSGGNPKLLVDHSPGQSSNRSPPNRFTHIGGKLVSPPGGTSSILTAGSSLIQSPPEKAPRVGSPEIPAMGKIDFSGKSALSLHSLDQFVLNPPSPTPSVVFSTTSSMREQRLRDKLSSILEIQQCQEEMHRIKVEKQRAERDNILAMQRIEDERQRMEQERQQHKLDVLLEAQRCRDALNALEDARSSCTRKAQSSGASIVSSASVADTVDYPIAGPECFEIGTQNSSVRPSRPPSPVLASTITTCPAAPHSPLQAQLPGNDKCDASSDFSASFPFPIVTRALLPFADGERTSSPIPMGNRALSPILLVDQREEVRLEFAELESKAQHLHALRLQAVEQEHATHVAELESVAVQRHWD